MLAAGFLGLAGCNTDNESDAGRLQKNTGAPPVTDVKGGEAPPQASNLDQYSKRHKEETSKDPRTSNYAKSVGGYRPEGSATKK